MLKKVQVGCWGRGIRCLPRNLRAEGLEFRRRNCYVAARRCTKATSWISAAFSTRIEFTEVHPESAAAFSRPSSTHLSPPSETRRLCLLLTSHPSISRWGRPGSLRRGGAGGECLASSIHRGKLGSVGRG